MSDTAALFHDDNDKVFDIPHLRQIARKIVLGSSLIKDCMAGEVNAARALHIGFWPFVIGFQKAIDERVNIRTLPRQPLYKRFTHAREVLAATPRNLRILTETEFNGVFGKLISEMEGMQREELTHAGYWVRDAANLGISRQELDNAPEIPGVKALLDRAYSEDLADFFGHLAGTEVIAEQLGADLDPTIAPLFNALFKNAREDRGRWTWGIVHTLPHHDGPSHLDIDLDWARAYNGDRDLSIVRNSVETSMRMFGHAADEVHKHFH